MTLKQRLGNLYMAGLRMFLYNDVVDSIFFSKGRAKKINGTSIIVPFKYSWFYPEIYEADKTDFIQQHCSAGDTVIDIGAHLGIFSFFLAKQVGGTGKVYSFEPAKKTFDALTKTLRYNNLTGMVEARQQAVSDSSGELTFYIYNNAGISNANSISSHNTVGKACKTTVSKISLDDLMATENIDTLTLIKIDAEGAELDILKGAEKLIHKFHPFITLEVHPKSFSDPQLTMKDLYETILRYGYGVFMKNHELGLQEFCSYNTYFEVLLLPAQCIND
jgi:FkbM family methyltransferase